MVHELYPYLHVADAAAAIRFYQEAFGARELFRLTEPPTGRLGHAELDFGGTTLMLSDEYPEMGIQGPRPGAPTCVSLHLHVDDADAVIARDLALGATLERPAQDEFYGERGGVVRDPFGHRWNIGHSIEKVTPEEMQRRYDALMAQGS
ncbi:VOC family protein [Acidovorax sp.]|uniref:VOC family protein n=1 Tax=Acidovorax sp. TaxID=1872122 RepID=UPI00391F393D